MSKLVEKIKESGDLLKTLEGHDRLQYLVDKAKEVEDLPDLVNQRDLEYKKAMVSSMKVYSNNLSTTISGMKGHKEDQAARLKEQNQQYQDFIWLIKG